MTVTISELHEWFRGERLSATHNALFEILVTGAPADVLSSASRLLARLRMGIGQVDAALLQLSTSPAPAREDRAERDALMAVGYAFKRCFDLAGEAMDRARSEAGEDPLVVLCDAMVQSERGALLSAAQLFSTALGDHRDRRFAYKGLSEVLRAAGDGRGASAALEGLLEHDADWAGTHRALGYDAMARGRFEEAARHFSKAIEAAPDGDYVNRDRYALGRALHAAGARDEAIAEWENLASTPGGPAALASHSLARLSATPPGARLHLIDTAPARLERDTALPAALSLYLRLHGRQPGPDPLQGGPPAYAPMPLGSVLDLLSASGLKARLFEGTAVRITSILDEGLPVLTFESHAVTGLASVACGHDDALGEIILLDPATGLLHETPLEEFEETVSRPAPPAIAAVDGLDGAAHLVEAARADAHRDAGRTDEGEGTYRSAIRIEPGCEPAHAGLLGLLLGRMASDMTSEAHRSSFEEALGEATSRLPGRAFIHLYEGRYRRLLGQHRKALASFKRAASIDPEDVHTLCDQASALLGTGSAEEGSELLRQALSLAPHHPRPSLELADVHAGLKEFRQADHYVRCALELDPGSAYGHEILAMVRRADGRRADALEELDTAARLGSDTDWFHLERAGNLVDLERWQEALSPLETVIERDDTNGRARSMLVEVLSKLGRGDEAVEAARFLLTIEPGQAGSHELLGLALETAGKTREVEAEYDHALEISPDHMPARARLDGLLALQDRHADRVGLWLVAARRDPAHPEIMSGLAAALEADGKGTEAERVRRRAAIAGGGPALPLIEELRARCSESADPRRVLEDAATCDDRATVLSELGRLLLVAGDPDAPSVWKQVVSLEPADPVAMAMLAHAMRVEDGRRHEMDEPRDPDTLDHAAQVLDHVLEMEPYWIWARTERARLALDMNGPQHALDVLEPVTEDRPELWDLRMTAHSRLGKHDRAAQAGDRLLEMPGTEPADLVRVALEHAAAGNTPRARDLAAQALEALPPGPSALRTRAEALLE